jgi:hypothetical protein
MMVTRKPDHQGEHEGSVKTITRGMPECFGVTVVTNACAFYTTHAAAGAASIRHSLRPLLSRALLYHPGFFTPWECEDVSRSPALVFAVMAGHSRAETMPSFERLCPVMTRLVAV